MSRKKKPSLNGMNRRDLLQMAMQFGSFAALEQLLALSPKALGATVNDEERHLVTFQWRGGYDQIWGLQGFLSREVLPGLPQATINTAVLGESGMRYQDGDALPMSRHYVGPAAIPLQSHFNDIAIWRGITAAAGHSLGNFRIQHGHQSSYANTYQGLIASAYAQAPHSLRPFHYTQIGVGDPAAFNADVGQNIGSGAIPIDIPDSATWDKLSIKIANDPTASASRRDMFLNTISNLSSRSYSITASQNLVTNFNSNITGAFNIIGQNFSTNPAYGFQAIYKKYLQAAVDGMSATCANPAALAGLKYQATILGVATNAPNVAKDGNVTAQAWRFAVTEFLLAHNLSFAVDVVLMSGDYHSGNQNDLYMQIINNSMINQFINFLKATPSGTGGKNLFDTTLTIMFAEFIRDTAVGVYGYNSNRNAGTDHGPTTLVMFAGGPTVPGIYGDIMTGPSGPLSAFSGNFFLGAGLPVDPLTGNPSLTGERYEQIAIFTTICAMWGVSFPAQQTTEASKVFPAIFKPGWA